MLNSFFWYSYIFYPSHSQFNIVCPTPQDQRGPGRCRADGGGTATGAQQLRTVGENSAQVLGILENPGESLSSSCNFDGRAMENVFSMVCIGLVSPGSLWLSEIFFALTCFEFINQMPSPNCSSMRRLPN